MNGCVTFSEIIVYTHMFVNMVDSMVLRENHNNQLFL